MLVIKFSGLLINRKYLSCMNFGHKQRGQWGAPRGNAMRILNLLNIMESQLIPSTSQRRLNHQLRHTNQRVFSLLNSLSQYADMHLFDIVLHKFWKRTQFSAFLPSIIRLVTWLVSSSERAFFPPSLLFKWHFCYSLEDWTLNSATRHQSQPLLKATATRFTQIFKGQPHQNENLHVLACVMIRTILKGRIVAT